MSVNVLSEKVHCCKKSGNSSVVFSKIWNKMSGNSRSGCKIRRISTLSLYVRREGFYLLIPYQLEHINPLTSIEKQPYLIHCLIKFWIRNIIGETNLISVGILRGTWSGLSTLETEQNDQPPVKLEITDSKVEVRSTPSLVDPCTVNYSHKLMIQLKLNEWMLIISSTVAQNCTPNKICLLLPLVGRKISLCAKGKNTLKATKNTFQVCFARVCEKTPPELVLPRLCLSDLFKCYWPKRRQQQ